MDDTISPLIIISRIKENNAKNKIKIRNALSGAREPGGSGGVGPPLELEINVVKISKSRKKNFFLSIGPPLGKNRSLAPVHCVVVF